MIANLVDMTNLSYVTNPLYSARGDDVAANVA